VKKKDRVVLQREFDRFATRFLGPLVAGGDMEVGHPIGPGAIDHFVGATPTDPSILGTIWEGLRLHIADVYEGTPRWTPGPDEIRLAAALHNLLWGSHPDASGKRGARRQVAGWTEAILGSVGPPATVESAVLRHAVVGRFAELARRDTAVSTWAYTHRFHGRAPPGRLVALPRVRRIRTAVSRVRFHDLPLGDEAEPLLGTLLRKTPLTMALRPTLPRPAFRWHAEVVDVLQDVSLCRSATYAWVDAWNEIPPIAGAALAALASAPLDPVRLAFVVCFHYNLLLTFAHVSGTETAERLLARPAAGPDAQLFYGTLLSALRATDALRAPHLPVPDPERARILQGLEQASAGEPIEIGRRVVEAAAGGIAAGR
jgi:hypothetical protein